MGNKSSILRLKLCQNFEKHLGIVFNNGNKDETKLVSYIMKLWKRVIGHRIKKIMLILNVQFNVMPKKILWKQLLCLDIYRHHREQRNYLHILFSFNIRTKIWAPHNRFGTYK